MTVAPPPAPPVTTYKCKNCPQSPVFLTKADLALHWQQTHTVPMVETVDTVIVLGQPIALQSLGLQPITRKHVEGPDV